MCNKLCEKHDITIFTIYAKGELEKELSNKITLKSLYNHRYTEMSKLQKMLLPLKIFFTKKSIYRKNIKGDYDTEVAFLEGPITNILQIKNEKVQKVAWIHNDISLVFGSGFKSKIKKILNKNIYKKYQKLVFVSNDNLEKFNKTYITDNEKYVVYNYIDPDKVKEKANVEVEDIFDKNSVNFVSVCRLVEQKAVSRLIKVHSRLTKDGVNHRIYIVGDGPLRESLEKEIEEDDVKDTFILLGQKENPYPYIKKAEVFCLFTYYEGYPMVIEEAKILSKYINITDTSAREVLRNYDNKLIVENTEEGIYTGIKEIVENKKKYSNESNSFKYSNEEILIKIEEIL